MYLRILGCILIVLYGALAYPQRQRESPDFNSNNKAGEKALRSLDQISLQDGTIRGRNSYTDSYGNPVAYDSLTDVDAQKPSSNKDKPHHYVIPGYASGILGPQEILSRNDNDEGRKIGDDKIHFVDPLNPNSFQTFNNPPSTSLTAPGTATSSFQNPIEIPRPNIDLNETPVNDPANLSLQPPLLDSNVPNATPATFLELPIDQDSAKKNPFLPSLTPPQLPNAVDIPRPNLNAQETPIDDNQNGLNQGLLPPAETSNTNFDTFKNPTQDGPIEITNTNFAPKPANGLLPPKEPLSSNFDFQAGSVNGINNVLPTASTSTKFSGNFEGTIGGGITTTTTQAPLLIPVQVIHSQDDVKINKYTGGFGGSLGVLTSNNVADRVVPTQITKAQSTTANSINNVVTPTVATATSINKNNNKFTGTFGGSLGVLSPGNSVVPTVNAPAIQKNEGAGFLSSNKKPLLSFGGPTGVLTPFDNLQKN